MSIEEDTELRDLVAQTLENKGILPKIRAELRANVFLALEENSNTKDTVLKNDDLSAFMQTQFGSLIINLVREFLEFFSLDFTLSVFDPETKYGKEYNNIAREKMMSQLNITEITKKKNPLLYDIICQFVQKGEGEIKQVNGCSERNGEALNLNHSEVTNNSEVWNTASPTALNSTYVKSRIEENSTPGTVHPTKFDKEDENDESIDEDLISNKSSLSENSSKDTLQIEKIKQIENSLVLSPFNSIDQESKPGLTNTTPGDSNEHDLLTFTPVKEVKTKDKSKVEAVQKDEKAKPNSLSVLGDLPPLNPKTEFIASQSKKGKMNVIKAIIDQGLDMDNYDEDFHSSLSSKGSRDQRDCEDDKLSNPAKSDGSQNSQVSDKSEKTETGDDENSEDDLSDLINSHISSENQITADETISKISGVGDHVESV